MQIAKQTRVDPMNYILQEIQVLQGERAIFGGCPVHWKALWVTAAVYAAKNNGISVTAGADSIAPNWPVSQ